MRARLLPALLLAALLLPQGTPPRAQSQDVATIQRGLYLARAGDCTACHSLPDRPAYAGGYPIDTPFGTVWTANITPDLNTGIGRWTSQDFYRAMNKGRRPDGRRLYPAFPYTHFTLIPREDSDAIFAYLQTLPPAENRVPAPDLIWPLGWRFLLSGWNMLNFEQREFRPDPAQSPEWNRGRYLVEGLGHCGMCHSPKNFIGAERGGAARYTGGIAEGWWAPSLRGDARDGLGAWSVQDIADFLRNGRNTRSIAFGPMAQVVEESTRHLTDTDLHAIATYLKSLPPAAAAAAEAPPNELPQADQRMGRLIYETQCAACHAPDGAGVANMVPPLRQSSFAQAANPRSVLRIILEGGQAASTDAYPTAHSMPAFGWKLSDSQVAAIASFVRNSFGNSAPLVQAADVARIRAER